MSGFFTGFNFARFIILVCFLGAGPLAYTAWNRYEANEALRAALAEGGEVERLITRIQENSRIYSKLMTDQRSEGLKGAQADVQSYIRGKAFGDKIELGDIEIDPGRPRSVDRGVQDRSYTIRTTERERAFQRTQIANFLFSLENQSRQVKVTDIDIEHEDRRLKPGQIPDRDYWKLSTTVTIRERTAE